MGSLVEKPKGVVIFAHALVFVVCFKEFNVKAVFTCNACLHPTT